MTTQAAPKTWRTGFFLAACVTGLIALLGLSITLRIGFQATEWLLQHDLMPWFFAGWLLVFVSLLVAAGYLWRAQHAPGQRNVVPGLWLYLAGLGLMLNGSIALSLSAVGMAVILLGLGVALMALEFFSKTL